MIIETGENFLDRTIYFLFPTCFFSYPYREKIFFCYITRGIEVVNVLFWIEGEERGKRQIESGLIDVDFSCFANYKKKGTTKFPKVGLPILAVGVLSLCTTYLASLIIFISSFPLSILCLSSSLRSSCPVYMESIGAERS